MARGIFFSFDGLDGGGKSTQMRPFCDWLVSSGREVVTCRDPGSTHLGETIRSLLLSRDSCSIGIRAELLLYMAARAQLVQEVIEPAIAAGKVVVSDRYLVANVAYQAYAGGLDIDEAWRIGKFATSDISPDLTFVLDLPVEIAWKRLNREHDRMEQRGPQFFQLVRDGFLTEARRNPQQMLLIDATRSIDEIQSEIRARTSALLKI